MPFPTDWDVVAWLCCIVAIVSCQAGLSMISMLYLEKEPSRNREYERQLALERLFGENDNTCRDMLRVSRYTFHRICQILEGAGLESSRWVGIPEQVAIFLLIVGHDTKMRHSGFDVIRSTETVHRHFHNVLLAILSLGKEWVKPARANFSPLMGDRQGWAMTYFK
ncbi:hypothetical protein MKW92_003327, partial [Papaver armeniacum]